MRNSLALCLITRERSPKIIKSNDYQFWAAGPRKAAGEIPRARPIHTAVKKSLLLLEPALRCLCCFRRCEPGIFHTFPVHVTDKMWIHLQQLSWQECAITYFLNQQSRVQLLQASRGPWNFVHLRRSPRTSKTWEALLKEGKLSFYDPTQKPTFNYVTGYRNLCSDIIRLTYKTSRCHRLAYEFRKDGGLHHGSGG